jgi:hypothetical protein
MNERERYTQMSEQQRALAQQLAETSPIGFWEAVDYLTRYGWDLDQARAAVQADYAQIIPGYRLVGKRYERQ